MTWTHKAAIGGNHRLRLGIGGASRSGKTYSALTIATGMIRVLGGEIFLIDTDNEFALDYGDDFNFQHVDFKPPYTPERYQSAVEYCVEQNASVIIVDQVTNEHTGQGGILERQQEVEKDLAAKWKTTREKVKGSSWNEAKTIPHGKFVSYITRVKQPMIFNFRAKDKIKIVKDERGKQEWIHCGYTPICTEQFDYEMTAMLILPPNSDGKPDRELSEIRKPLRGIISVDQQINESMGERLAEWAKGGSSQPLPSGPKPATKDQLSRIMEIMKSHHFTEPSQILKQLSEYCNRPIGSSKDLTSDEAADFIDTEDAMYKEE